MAVVRRILRRNVFALLKCAIYLLLSVTIILYWSWAIDEHHRNRSVRLNPVLRLQPISRDAHKMPQPPGEQNGPKENMIRENLGNGSKGVIVDADLVDWHDKEAMTRDKARTGPGENGQRVTSPNQDPKCYAGYGYNSCTSKSISLNRSVADIRHPECNNKKYLRNLYTVSIIIPFYDEHRQTLLRAVYSLINRSPPEVLKEILLVDDGSSQADLKESFDAQLKEEFKNVRVIRSKERDGLIRARLLGAREATADVLLFLDSHIEVNYNWLPPLIDPIVRNWKNVVCPMIDKIHAESFAYHQQDGGARGAFDWRFNYKRLPRLQHDLLHRPADLFQSPVMAGGLFAIHKDWFWKLGGYDPGLEIWGGEQYELSFKVWQCGGQMFDAPCSRVGHIFKKFSKNYVSGKLQKNYKRVADVWMDEYKHFIFKGLGISEQLDSGDVTKQKAVREKLQCKSFKWFLTEVAFDLEKYYPSIPPKPFATGPIRNKGCGLCISGRRRQPSVDLVQCQTEQVDRTQAIELSWKKEIRLSGRDWGCLDVNGPTGTPLIFYGCHSGGFNQRFKYNLDQHQINHFQSGNCLQTAPDCKAIKTAICVDGNINQQWDFGSQNETALRLLWTHTGHHLDVLT